MKLEVLRSWIHNRPIAAAFAFSAVGLVLGLLLPLVKLRGHKTYEKWAWMAANNPKEILSTKAFPDIDVPRGGLMEFHTVYDQTTDAPVFRTVVLHQREGHMLKGLDGIEEEGPLSPSGKWHGQTTVTIWEPFKRSSKWYWYGEEVSEGEWHLRNHR